MRCRMSCQISTSCAPKKLVANRPVSSTTAMVSSTPRPGMCTPSQASVRSSIGSSSSDWSSASKMNFRTQMVMTSGIQISRPVMRYFFNALKTKRPGSRRAGAWSGCPSVGRGRGLGLRFGARVGLRFGLRVGLRLALGFGFLLRRLLALEIGGVPAAALQLEAGRGELLLEGRLAARRALAEYRVGHLLQEVLLVATSGAAVLIDRHGRDYISDFRKECRLPCRRTCPPASSPPRASARRRATPPAPASAPRA